VLTSVMEVDVLVEDI